MKTKMSRKDWKRHFEKFERSGLTQIEYCRQHNINKGTFSAQKSSFKKKKNDGLTNDPIFIPIKKDRSEPLTIKFNGCFEATFSEMPDPLWMAKFIQFLRGNDVTT